MSVRSVTRRAQRRAMTLLLDTALIEESTGEHEDPDTLELVETWATVYDGRARFKPSEGAGWEARAGEGEFTQAALILQLPIDAPVPPMGCRVTCTAVDPVAGDPHLVGRIFWTSRSQARSQATKREVILTEVREHG